MASTLTRLKPEEHLKAVRRVAGILPVGRIVVEVAPFDTQLLKNPDIEGKDDMVVSVLPKVTEFQSFEHTCSCGCHVEGEFPPHVKAPVCYGPGVRATVAYLNSNHSMPFKRLAEVMGTFFGISMSQGTVSNILNDMRKCCGKKHEEIRGGSWKAPRS